MIKSKTKAHKILFLVPYPQGLGPSQRFRIEIYFEALRAAEVQFDYHPFLSKNAFEKLHRSGGVISKVLAVCFGFLKRWILMFQIFKYDRVVVQREAAPLGPALFEWIITKVYKKDLIYDLDDAIWLPNFGEANARIHKLKWYKKVDAIMKWSHTVIAGNEFLANRARLFNSQVELIPTIVDTENYHVPKRKTEGLDKPLVLGWTGTHSTNRHIEYLSPVLNKLNQYFDFKLRVISNLEPSMDLKNLEYLTWNAKSEISDLQELDLGLMPLIPDFEFAEGKCGFKAIQYMALQIPVVASSIGVNSTIIQNHENGFIADNLDEWYNVLHEILSGQIQLGDVAMKGRRKIEAEYSLKSTREKFIQTITS